MRTIDAMRIADQERAEHQAYLAALPAIVRGVSEGQDFVQLAAAIAVERDYDERTVYLWITTVDRQIDRARRRAAVLAVAPVWLGGLALVGAGLAALLGWWGTIAIVASAVAGLLAIGASALVLRGLRGRAAQRWLHRELADR